MMSFAIFLCGIVLGAVTVLWLALGHGPWPPERKRRQGAQRSSDASWLR